MSLDIRGVAQSLRTNALENPKSPRSLILGGPCLSYPRWAEDELHLLEELSPEMQETIQHHELDGEPDSSEYQAAITEHERRNWCRLDYLHPLIAKSFAGGGREVHLTMWGANHFFPTGNLKNCDLSSAIRTFLREPFSDTRARSKSFETKGSGLGSSRTRGLRLNALIEVWACGISLTHSLSRPRSAG
jgi:hypothetical protein